MIFLGGHICQDLTWIIWFQPTQKTNFHGKNGPNLLGFQGKKNENPNCHILMISSNR